MGWFGMGDGYSGPTLKSAGVRYMPGDSPGKATRAIIEGIDASGNKVHIQASDAALKAHGLDPRLASQERIDIATAEFKGQADRAELRQGQAARAGEDRRRFDIDVDLRRRESARADKTTDANIATQAAQVGIAQQAANTNEMSARSDAEYKQGTLSLNERQRIDQNRQFDQTHLLAQQQNAMNYNLTATRLNNDIEAQSYDRRLRTMEGIGAAIAGLAAMIGG